MTWWDVVADLGRPRRKGVKDEAGAGMKAGEIRRTWGSAFLATLPRDGEGDPPVVAVKMREVPLLDSMPS